jgi:hypothetical protein
MVFIYFAPLELKVNGHLSPTTKITRLRRKDGPFAGHDIFTSITFFQINHVIKRIFRNLAT